MLKSPAAKISKHMLDPQITTEVLNTVHTVNAVGLKEIWISIEATLAQQFIDWALAQNLWVEHREWNYPQGLYVGTGKATDEPLRVFSVSWQ